MPWLFVFCILLLPLSAKITSTSPVKAKSALESYKSGDFKTAEESWKLESEKAPTDWRLRNNLGLALLQQGNSDVAAAQLSVAFVQHPTDETVQVNLRLALQQAKFTPQQISELLQDHPLAWFGRQASPAHWQLLSLGGAALLLVSMVLLLLGGYGWKIPAIRPVCNTLLIVALLSITAGLVGHHLYGTAADENAAIVARNCTLYSLPTEAETAQKTTSLPAGSVVVIDKSFLSWRHLRFPDGQGGWARSDDLVMFWK
jgi:hypothetical protein